MCLYLNEGTLSEIFLPFSYLFKNKNIVKFLHTHYILKVYPKKETETNPYLDTVE